jgi:membrane protein
MSTMATWRMRASQLGVLLRASIAGRVLDRLLEVEALDKAVALAAKAFVALFPLLVVVATYGPANFRESMLDVLRDRFGVSGSAGDVVASAFNTGEQVRSATGVIGLVVLVLYATTFTTALHRIYLRVWRRPGGQGLAGQLRGLRWVAGIVALLALGSLTTRVVGGLVGTGTQFVVALAAGIAFWWWTGRAMTRREVRWRPLLPGAVLTAAAMHAYAFVAPLWMPTNVQNNADQFGFFGVALALVTWFVGAAYIIIGSAVIGAVLADDTGRIGRLVRGPSDQVLEPDAPADVLPPNRATAASPAVSSAAAAPPTTA